MNQLQGIERSGNLLDWVRPYIPSQDDPEAREPPIICVKCKKPCGIIFKIDEKDLDKDIQVSSCHRAKVRRG